MTPDTRLDSRLDYRRIDDDRGGRIHLERALLLALILLAVLMMGTPLVRGVSARFTQVTTAIAEAGAR